MSDSATALELMVFALARDISDGELAFVGGVVSEIPHAACLLAQRLHAPNLTIYTVNAAVNPRPLSLQHSGPDGPHLRGVEAVTDYHDIFEFSERGADFVFYGGIQIDAFGNTNLHFIGDDWENPVLRGPGVANISLAVTSGRTYLYSLRHDQRTFRPKVDFITIPGHLDGPDGRHRAGIQTEGPRLCVTPLGVFDFPESTRRMRLASLHPGVSLDTVLERTGFALEGVREEVPATPRPKPSELRLLRQEIDRNGLLRREA